MALRPLLALITFWFSVFLCSTPALATSANRPSAVLVLVSYAQGGATIDEYVRVLKDELYSAGFQHDAVHIEHLNLGITQSAWAQKTLSNLLVERYADRNIVAIAAVQQPAFEFLFDHLAELSPRAPVLGFASHATATSLESSRHAVFQSFGVDYAGTAKHALALFPQTKRVVFFNGSSAGDQARFANMRKEVQAFAPHLALEDTHALSYASALDKLSGAQPDTVVIAFGYSLDVDGVSQLSPVATTRALAQQANAPVFVTYDQAMGTGAVGGMITVIGQEARAAASWILGHMKAPGGLTPVPSTTPQAIFDWQQIKRWNGQLHRLPADAVVINKPPTLWAQYRSYVLTNTLAIAVLMTLVGSLLWQRRLRNRALLQLEQSEQRFRVLVENAPEAVLVYDHDSGLFIDANRNAEALFGCSRTELLTSSPARFYTRDAERTADTNTQVHASLSRVFEGLDRVVERTIYAADHREVVCEVRSVPLPWPKKTALRLSYIDISERRAAQHHIHDLAFFDPLTHLSNRRLFVDRLNHAIATYRRKPGHGAMLFLDLDHFKHVNDAMGHSVGDKLLVQVAERLKACLREVDLAARFGSDEFVVLIESLSPCEETAHGQVLVVCEKLLLSLRAPFDLNDRPVGCTTSIGAVVFGESPTDTDTLFQQGDMAMLHAKGDGRNTVRFFNADIQAAAMARAALEAELRDAIETDQIQTYYQPQVNARGQVIGAEALARWYHTSQGFIAPAQFIPIAEQAGMIHALGLAVLRDACGVLQRWAVTPDCENWTVAINVSVYQFRERSFVDDVLAVLRSTRANPALLKFEITESILVTDVEATIQTMDALRAHGIAFSLDDFGTGYSSLSYLRRLPLTQLKIDQSFVRDALTNANAAAITQTIIALGDSLGLSVLAEGVETPEQHEFLQHHGCNAYQGFLFGKPTPIARFKASNLTQVLAHDRTNGNP